MNANVSRAVRKNSNIHALQLIGVKIPVFVNSVEMNNTIAFVMFVRVLILLYDTHWNNYIVKQLIFTHTSSQLKLLRLCAMVRAL